MAPSKSLNCIVSMLMLLNTGQAAVSTGSSTAPYLEGSQFSANQPNTSRHHGLQVKPGQVPVGIAQSEWHSIQSQVNQAAYQVYPSKQGGYTSSNPANGWHIVFGMDGTTTVSAYDKSTAEDYRISLHLNSVAYQSSAANQVSGFAQPAGISFNGDRLNYHWNDDITEYWINSEQKLEQWFEIKQRPQNSGADSSSGLLQVQMNLDTDLEVSLMGNRLRLGDITYDQLKVWDANGQAVDAHLDLQGQHLSLLIEDEHATYPLTVDPSFTQQAYLKAANAEAGDVFGSAVAIFGNTLVVGAPREGNSGAVYVFIRTGTTWSQQAYLKAAQPSVDDFFGISVSIFADTLVVGASGEGSIATGVNGNETDNSAPDSGAAYVFVRNFGVWTQQAYIKASNTDAGDRFGTAVAYYNETLVIGAYKEASIATGIDGDQSNNTITESGAAYVFVRNGTTWSQQAYLKASNTDAFDYFGRSVSLSLDTVVIGATGEDSNATGVNGNQGSQLLSDSGAAYVFVRNGSTWSQQAYVKASNTGFGDAFGGAVHILNNTLVIGAASEDSHATGVGGDQFNNSAEGSGAVYVFVRDGLSWSQQAYLKASNTGTGDGFGDAIAVHFDSLLIGAPREDSDAIGVNGNQTNDAANNSGAAYVFVRSGSTWSQQAYLKASNTGSGDFFGDAVSYSGGSISIGAIGESSNATGINGNQASNSAADAGAAYVTSVAYKVGGTVTGLASGNSVTLQNNGTDDLNISANGLFSFPNALPAPATNYAVTVLNQPTTPNQTCTVDNASGTVTNTDINDVVVSCNAIPTIVADFYTTLEDLELQVLDKDGQQTPDPNDDSVLVNDSDPDFNELFVVTQGIFTAGGVGGLIQMFDNGTFIYQPPDDAFGTATFDYEVSDGLVTVSAQLEIDVLSVNDAPSFSLAGDVELDSADLISNPLEINGFITGFNLGPANESTQVIDEYEVLIQSDTDNIVNAVTVDNEGVLEIDFTTNTGVALIDVTLQDDGGTALGGVDRSAAQSFFIAFNDDLIFINGFEISNDGLILQYINQIQQGAANLDFPVYDVAVDAVEFYGEWYFISGDHQQPRKLQTFEHWLKEVLLYQAPFVDYDNDGVENYLDQQPFNGQ